MDADFHEQYVPVLCAFPLTVRINRSFHVGFHLSTVEVGQRPPRAGNKDCFAGHGDHAHGAVAGSTPWRLDERFGWSSMGAAQPESPTEHHPDQPLDFVDLDLGVGAHPAIMPHLLKAARQNVLGEVL